jgi:adenylate cyclase
MNLKENIIFFFEDKAHIYITLGGILLGISLGIGRMKIAYLKEKINDLFGRYIDASIRDQLIENNGVYEEKRELCILFSDIRNFTQISEQHESPEIIEALNIYFSMWDEVSNKHNGIINKFIGDAVMIIFGLHNDFDSENDAVKCSTEILNTLDSLNETLKEKKLPEFTQIGIGIHSGELILGNVGSNNRKELTVIGDVVNTSSRLETATKDFDKSLIISEEVFHRLNDNLKSQFVPSKPITLKGKTKAFPIYIQK